jgi:uncharacterized RDD family membrane protein YckC
MILHQVISTEKVPFAYRVAGMGSRFLAWLVDFGLILLLLFAGSVLALAVERGRAGAGQGFILLWIFGVSYGYGLLFEWLWHGQTPGKRLLGIRVITWKGTGISFMHSALRNVLRLVDGFPPFLPVFYPLGFAVAACNREHRRLGDLAGDTLVVHVERKAKPIRALQEAGAETDRAWRVQVRQRLNQLNREQKQAILDLCLRRDQLRVSDRARLFRATAEYFQDRLSLAPEAFQSDEKFVLLLAAEIGDRSPVSV